MKIYYTTDDAPLFLYDPVSFSYMDYNGLKLPVFMKDGIPYVATLYSGGFPISDLSHYFFKRV